MIHKLEQKGFAADVVQRVVEDLQQRGWQSDERFAESRVRHRLAAGWGLRRIRQELAHLGLDRALVEQALAREEPDWLAQAMALYRRRYPGPPRDDRERQRRMQFLARRGYDYSLIQQVMQQADEQ